MNKSFCTKVSKPLVSVVIPVYNRERFLRQCVESVLEQTYTNFEVLLVNDGSTDSSGLLCDELASKDCRVRVLHKSNTGVSSSRNLALDIITGDYVIMLDSDDYWRDKTCIQYLVDIAERYNVDIVRGEYLAVDKNSNDLFASKLDETRSKNTNRILSAATFVEEVIQLEFFLCLCLIRRSVLGDLRYNSEYVFLEDIELFIRILLKSPKCYYVPLYFYAYRKHVDAVSATYNLRKLKNGFALSYFLYSSAQCAIESELKQYCIREAVRRYYFTMRAAASSAYFGERKSLIEQFKLKQMWKDVAHWRTLCACNHHSLVYYLPPLIGLWYMYISNIALDMIYTVRVKLLKRS